MNRIPFAIRKWATNAYWLFALPLQRAWWFLARPRTTGAKCLVQCGEEILLVRIAYGHRKWTIPGGGSERGEDPLATALRELKEETGIVLASAERLGALTTDRNFRHDTLHAYRAFVPEKMESHADGIEIQEARWFPLDRLPADRSESTDRILAMVRDEGLEPPTFPV